MNICKKCSKDKFLKKIIKTKGLLGSCNLCGKRRKKVLSIQEKIFIKSIACLVRYHYSEWEYHTKLGGNDLGLILTDQNPLFNYPKHMSILDAEEFVQKFIHDIYEDKDVHIITAYGREIYSYIPLDSVSMGNNRLINIIKNELKTKNYFLLEPKYVAHFDKLKAFLTKNISIGKTYYRARIGAKKSAEDFIIEKNSKKCFYTPHQDKKIGAPPIALATSGRVNRLGVSYLYLASDLETAISEVRPHPGEEVSIGKFLSMKKITVADLSRHQLTEELMSDEGLDILAIIIAMEKTMANASPPSNNIFYGITQFITEMFRKMGFDGIMFKSSISSGINLVVFDPENFEWHKNSGEVHKIKTLKYSYSVCDLFDKSKEYDQIL